MSNPVDTFRSEAEENLAMLETALLEMEANPDDPELIALAFRAMHTIKGAGGMVGFSDLSDFTHYLESAFDKVRNQQYSVTAELISILLDAKDHLAGMLEQPEQTPVQSMVGQALLARLNEIIPGDGSSIDPVVTSVTAEDDGQRKQPEKALRVRFTPSQSTFVDGFDVLPILNELNSFGTSYVTTICKDVPAIIELEPEQSYLSWDIILITDQSVDTIKDSFIFVSDDWKISIEEVEDSLLDYEYFGHIGEILVERGLITAEQVDDVLTSKPKTGELMKESGLISDSDVEAALAEQKALREAKERKAGKDEIVRVPASRLDALMNLVGELVIVQARMNQVAQAREDEELFSVSEELDRLTVDLRDNTFSIRMLPIGSTFGRFRRLVRDLSRELGKEIKLETQGADTELDKMVLDRMGDPLVHLIRNSIDHGIEIPEARQAAGKEKTGTIHLSAEHAESHVVIRIRDDGAGLNTSRIRDKAIEKGLITPDSQLSDDEVNNLIFEPGFSTAQQVSDVSGRGVGMDVVKRSIQELGGHVSINSEHGCGTTIKITLPMTLAIIEGLMVVVDDEKYVLPLSAVEECVELLNDGKCDANGKRLVDIRGDLVPYMRLREWFHVDGAIPPIEQVVVTRMGDERFGFSVDEVIGQYQTVIKRLGKFYEGVKGFAGATILGDGNVAMILDTAGLIEAQETEAR